MTSADPIAALELSPEDAADLRGWTRTWNTGLQPVAFVGAGLSAFHGVPRRERPTGAVMKTWDQLSADFADAMAIGGGEKDEYSPLPRDPLRLAELVASQTSRATLLEIVRRAVPDEHYRPGRTHGAFARTPWSAIVTTNYDTLLERAYEGRRVRPHLVVDDADLTRPREVHQPLLVKMHGDLRRPDSIVISEDDYRRYGTGPFPRAAVALKVRQLMVEHPVIFLGYGLADPNVEHLLGWVRDTVGKLQTPAIAVVHGTPRRAERVLWARRGVKLVVCGREPADLRALLEAIDDERVRPSYSATVATALKNLRMSVESLEQTVLAGRSDEGAVAAADAFVVHAERALKSRIDTEARGFVRRIARYQSDRADWRPLLSALKPALATRLAVVLSHTGFAFKVHHHRFVDLRVGLLAFGKISDSERVRLATAWLDDRIADASVSQLDSYLGPLQEWRAAMVPEVHPDLDQLILDLTRIRMDAQGLRQLARHPGTTPQELCCTGATLLALGDIEGAGRLYRDARGRARTPEEIRAALIGLIVAEDDVEARRELEREQVDVGGQLFEFDSLRQSASQHALAGHVHDAAADLASYARAARRHGLPDQWGPVAKAARRSSVLLLESDESSAAQLVNAVGLRIQFGIVRDAHKDVPEPAVERAARTDVARERLRELLFRPGLPERPHRAQQTHAVLAFDILTDGEIDRMVAELIRDARDVSDDHGSRSAQDVRCRWEAVERSVQRLPPESIKRVAAFLARDSGVTHRASSVLSTGLVPSASLRGTREITSLAKWTSAQLKGPLVGSDYVVRRGTVGIALELARLVPADQRLEWCTTIEQHLGAALNNPKDKFDSTPVELLCALIDLGYTPKDLGRATDFLLGAADEAASSSLLPQWAAAVELVAKERDDRRTAVRAALRRAAVRALPHARRGGPFATAFSSTAVVHALITTVKVAGGRLSADEIDLLGEYARVNPSALGLFARPEIGISQQRRARAEGELAEAALVHSNRGAAVRGLVEWCTHRKPSRMIGDLLVGLLAAGPIVERRVVARGIGGLVRAGKLSAELSRRVASRMVDATGRSRPWHERAQAILAVGALRSVLGAQGRRTIQELSNDDVTIVRRAAQLAIAGD